MNRAEHNSIRQKELFDFIDKWTGLFFMSNTAIMSEMANYQSTKTVERDINTLTDKFLIHKEYIWRGTKSTRVCKVVNRNKDLRWQSDSNYLEAIVLANPDCFKIHWRIGYDHYYGGIRKYIDVLDEHKGVTCTGVYLLKEPNKMLSKRPIRYKRMFVKDPEAIGQEIDQPIPF